MTEERKFLCRNDSGCAEAHRLGLEQTEYLTGTCKLESSPQSCLYRFGWLLWLVLRLRADASFSTPIVPSSGGYLVRVSGVLPIDTLVTLQ